VKPRRKPGEQFAIGRDVFGNPGRFKLPCQMPGNFRLSGFNRQISIGDVPRAALRSIDPIACCPRVAEGSIDVGPSAGAARCADVIRGINDERTVKFPRIEP